MRVGFAVARHVQAELFCRVCNGVLLCAFNVDVWAIVRWFRSCGPRASLLVFISSWRSLVQKVVVVVVPMVLASLVASLPRVPHGMSALMQMS